MIDPKQFSEADITAHLRNIIDPVTRRDIITAHLISGIVIRGSRIGLMINTTPEDAPARAVLQEQITHCLLALDGIDHVTPVLTGQHDAPATSAPAPRAKARWNTAPVDNVTRVIAIASGKGGVGKSTISASLALAAANAGLHVGIVDADIHGPSLPHMFGRANAPKPEARDGRLIPPVAGGVQLISTGLLLEAGQAAIMRGAMVSKTITQLIRGVHWGAQDTPLDILFIDMPPGTGDVALSLVQNVPLARNRGGALLVTTPQDIATIDATKALRMFEKTNTPVLGIVENMSWLEQSDGTRITPFGSGGGAALADAAQAPMLAQLPLTPALGRAADTGTLATYCTKTPVPWSTIITQLL